MEARIKEIISEAVQTNSITRITYQEREALGRIYKEQVEKKDKGKKKGKENSETKK